MEGIQDELDTYNPLVPESGHLCATLFLELTSDDAMREWLPRLVGIERHVVFRLADGTQIRSALEAQHASQLTREHVTSCCPLPDVRFRLSLRSRPSPQVARRW